MTPATRAGTTLIELLVTLTILGMIAGVTTLAVRRLDAPRPDDPQRMLTDSLRAAASLGIDIRLRLTVAGRAAHALVNADGSILADSALGVDRLTGAPLDARQ